MNAPGKYTTTMQSAANSSRNFLLKELLNNHVLLVSKHKLSFMICVFKLEFKTFPVKK
jgi:hypothetical protein